MTGDDVRIVFEPMLPQDEMDRLCQQCGVIERQRKLNLGMLVRAMVISAGTPGGAYQADVLRSYLEFEVPRVTRAAFYRWFDTPLERCMAALAERALAYAQAQQVDLPGPLSGVKDWYIVDSTTVRVCDALIDEFRGAGAYAALKVHKVLSVGCGAPVRDHFSPAREHDSPPLEIDESWLGYGLLADLAYASLARLRACETDNVRFVIRLKDNWKPKVDDIARGQVTQAFFPGTDLQALLADDLLRLDGRAIDADIHVGGEKHPLPLRLVGIQTPTGYCFLLTNLPPRIGPRQVADLYRVRWEVELSIQLDTSVHRLDAIDAERPCFPEDAAACLAHRLDSGCSLGAYPQSPDPSHPTRGTTHRGAAPHQTPGLAVGGILPVHRPGLRFEGNGGQAAVGQDCGAAHTCWYRPQLASSPVRLGSVTRLEAPTRRAR
jgi:hypothetical protein